MLSEFSQNSQEDTCVSASFVHPFVKIESLTQVFFCEFCQHLSKNIIFYRTTEVAASVKACDFTKTRLCHGWGFFVDFLKILRTVFCCAARIFRKLLVKKRLAKNLSADGYFAKTIILLTVIITTMLSVSW